MGRTEIMERIANMLKQDFNVKIDVDENTALIKDNILDSLDFMNYITMIESSYKISISNEDILESKLGIIGNMVIYIEKATGTGK